MVDLLVISLRAFRVLPATPPFFIVDVPKVLLVAFPSTKGSTKRRNKLFNSVTYKYSEGYIEGKNLKTHLPEIQNVKFKTG